jgi:hypothetical protein
MRDHQELKPLYGLHGLLLGSFTIFLLLSCRRKRFLSPKHQAVYGLHCCQLILYVTSIIKGNNSPSPFPYSCRFYLSVLLSSTIKQAASVPAPGEERASVCEERDATRGIHIINKGAIVFPALVGGTAEGQAY